MDNTALFKVGYGLYVLTAQDGEKDNGCIINTVLQVTSTPLVGVIAVNKLNYTNEMINKTGKFNVSVLTTETPFSVFEHFGFQSGAMINKFDNYGNMAKSENEIIYLPKYSNAYLSFQVIDAIDFGTHTMFKANITNGQVIGSGESLTYAYYQQHIKPKKPQTATKGYRCNICGYIYEGEPLPADFICPICKHGASNFTKIT